MNSEMVESLEAVNSDPGDLENSVLRRAVQQNLVSFPAQIPGLGKRSRPDLQPKIVALYFISGWTMDDIGRRYGLGRQRMGQILTDWRIRAVKDGYVQAIQPEHQIFKRVRLEQASQFSGEQVRIASAVARNSKSDSASEVDQPSVATPGTTEPGGSNVAEQLNAIVCILDNQLRLCSKPLHGSIDSCEQLLDRAKMLCARLEGQLSAFHKPDEGRTKAIISAAKELFQRFQNHAFLQFSALSTREFGHETQDGNIPPRTSQRVAVGL